jgi:hypothetical protein
LISILNLNSIQPISSDGTRAADPSKQIND